MLPAVENTRSTKKRQQRGVFLTSLPRLAGCSSNCSLPSQQFSPRSCPVPLPNTRPLQQTVRGGTKILLRNNKTTCWAKANQALASLPTNLYKVKPAKRKPTEPQSVNANCTICGLIYYEPVTTPCNHSFCRRCLQIYARKQLDPRTVAWDRDDEEFPTQAAMLAQGIEEVHHQCQHFGELPLGTLDAVMNSLKPLLSVSCPLCRTKIPSNLLIPRTEVKEILRHALRREHQKTTVYNSQEHAHQSKQLPPEHVDKVLNFVEENIMDCSMELLPVDQYACTLVEICATSNEIKDRAQIAANDARYNPDGRGEVELVHQRGIMRRRFPSIRIVNADLPSSKL